MENMIQEGNKAPRVMTAKENISLKKLRAEVAAQTKARKDAEAQKATDKASAVSKLEALGLTSSEVNALTK